MPFRIQSIFCLDVFLRRTSPSFLYKSVDCLSSLFDKKENIWMPTSSHILAQLKLPMVMVKQLSVFFFLPRFVIINKDFLQCFIIRFKSFSRISMYRWENRVVLFNISSDIDG